MNEFVPRGYLPLKEALEYFGRRRETAKPSDIGREVLDHELENTEKASSKQEFQQLLFEKTVSAKLFIGGRLLSLESSIWGSGEAEYIFASGWATIHGGNEYFPAEVRGRVLIKQSSIDALFDGDSDEVETGAEDPTAQTQREQDEPGPQIGGNDQRETQRERSAGSGARSKTRGKPGKRVGNYHKPMCAALGSLCSNHGLDKVEDWNWTHLRQRIERHHLFKGGYTLPEDSQFRKVCNEWFDKAAESGKYRNASR